MKKIRILVIYLICLIVYYLVFNNISLSTENGILVLFEANSTYNIENNFIIINNFIIFNTINLIILSYMFNVIDELINMRNYIEIRTKKFTTILLKTILKSSIMFIFIKLILDLIITRGNFIKDILIINFNILLSILIYCLLYLLLSLNEVISKKSLSLIIFLNLVGGLIYYKFNILRVFVYFPLKNYLNVNFSIINKFIFLIILFILTIHYENSNK